MTRVLVTGSRTWQNRAAIVDALDQLLAEHGVLTVVHGNAPGADRIAHNWALSQHYASSCGAVTPEAHPADWKKFGKRAGMFRNSLMVELGADVCLAFIRNQSPGATQCAALAEKAGIPVRRFTEGPS